MSNAEATLQDQVKAYGRLLKEWYQLPKVEISPTSSYSDDPGILARRQWLADQIEVRGVSEEARRRYDVEQEWACDQYENNRG